MQINSNRKARTNGDPKDLLLDDDDDEYCDDLDGDDDDDDEYCEDCLDI